MLPLGVNALPQDIADGFICSDEEKKAAVTAAGSAVSIDPARMLLAYERPPSSPAVIARQQHDVYLRQMEQAVEVQQEGIKLARDLSVRVSRGEDLPLAEAKDVIRGIIASLATNRNVIVGLTRLKQWDEYTYTHCMNVSLYASLLCKYLGGDDELAEEIGMSGFFHDIGKLFIPQNVINFPGKLNPEQVKLIRKHPEYGNEYVRALPGISPGIRQGIFEHHERYDGAGYPSGKKGKELSQAGTMLLVADIYDALSSRRSYKLPMSPGDALALMYREREGAYAPGMLESFIKAVSVYPSGCLVSLSDGATAVVTEQTNESLYPRVVVLTGREGEPLRPPRLLDLSHDKRISIQGCNPPTTQFDLQKAIFEAA